MEILQNIDWKTFFTGGALGSILTYLINYGRFKLAKNEYDLKIYDRRIEHYNRLEEIHDIVKNRKYIIYEKINGNNITRVNDSLADKALSDIRFLKNKAKKFFGNEIKDFLSEYLTNADRLIYERMGHGEDTFEKKSERQMFILNLDLKEKYKKYLDL